MAKEMINSTKPTPKGETEGLGQTLKAYEEFDMNHLNDPTGTHPEYDGSKINNKGKK